VDLLSNEQFLAK